MDTEWKFRHKEELESNCKKLHALLKSGSSNWQIGWNKGINDIFNGTYAIGSNLDRLNALNLLLKVAEVAFKERTYRIRIEAYVCWRHFISTVEKYGTNGYPKLLKMLLVPLSASNHSQVDVLQAKLQTWATMLATPFVQEASICDSAASHLLKILYGPHALKTASTVPDLIEDCAVLFKKMWTKCEHTDANERLVEYIPLVIASLTADQRLYELAEDIWCKVLDNVKANGWPDVHSKHLISTFKNLIDSEHEYSHKLIIRLLIKLLEKHSCFPARLLNDFYAMELNDRTDFSGQKQINLKSYWTTAIDYVSDQRRIATVAAAENLTWILILPIKFLYDKFDDATVDTMRLFYEMLCRKSDHVDFTKLLMRNLTDLLRQSRASLSFLNATVRLCKIIALATEKLKKKVSTATITGMREVLLEINAKIKLLSDRIVKDDESFVAGYVACILLFMRECPQFDSDFVPLLRDYNLRTSDEDCKELPVARLMNKYVAELRKPRNLSLLSASPSVITITPSTSRNKSSLTNSSLAAKSPVSIISAQKSQKYDEDNESVEFVTIQPKVSQSPLTEHQKEAIKSKKFIPAMYEDLSQSQSNSLIESASLLPSTTAADIGRGGNDFMEEDANLSPPNADDKLDETESETVEIIAATRPFNFDNETDAVAVNDDQTTETLSSEADVRSIAVEYANIENICIATEAPIVERSPIKRRSVRLRNKPSSEIGQPKRRRRATPRDADDANSVDEIAAVFVVEQNHDKENDEKKQKPNGKRGGKKQQPLACTKNETAETMEIEEQSEPDDAAKVQDPSPESVIKDVTNEDKGESDNTRTDGRIVAARVAEEADSSIVVVENAAACEVISIVDSDSQRASGETRSNEEGAKSGNESTDEAAADGSKRENDGSGSDGCARSGDVNRRKRSRPSKLSAAYSNHRLRGIVMTKLAGNENVKDARSMGKVSSSKSVGGSKATHRPMSERTMNILTASVGRAQGAPNDSGKIRVMNEDAGGERNKVTAIERVPTKPPSCEANATSQKIMNLMDRMTRTENTQDEESYQNSTSDERSDDMIADDEATSQDILYTPLQSCPDEIDAIVRKLNMHDVAVDLFHRMGIKRVGDLASMSTIAAKSIPAGDNRVRRLRDALKKYKEERGCEAKSTANGSQTITAREENAGKCSSLVELLDEIEKSSQKANRVPNVVPDDVYAGGAEISKTSTTECELKRSSLEEECRAGEPRPQDEQMADKTTNEATATEKPGEESEETDEIVEMTTTTTEDENEKECDEQWANERVNLLCAVRSEDGTNELRERAVRCVIVSKEADVVESATNHAEDDNFSPEIIETVEPSRNGGGGGESESAAVGKGDKATDVKYGKKALASKLQSIFWVSVSQLAVKRLARENGEKTGADGGAVEDVVEMVIKILKELANCSEKGCLMNSDQKRDLVGLCKTIFDKCSNET